jgi:hypothetical protein
MDDDPSFFTPYLLNKKVSLSLMVVPIQLLAIFLNLKLSVVKSCLALSHANKYAIRQMIQRIKTKTGYNKNNRSSPMMCCKCLV